MRLTLCLQDHIIVWRINGPTPIFADPGPVYLVPIRTSGIPTISGKPLVIGEKVFLEKEAEITQVDCLFYLASAVTS
jgi:hypothetical protein